MRVYKRKTERGLFSREAMLEGVRLVLDQGQKIKPTARELGLNYKTLGRYVALKRNSINIDNKQFGYSKVHKRILNDEQEQMLADYLIQANRIYYGLTKIEFRTLTFEFAKINNIPTPTSWKKNQMASKDWVYQFFNRHPEFSLRTPEPTSLARMTSFNKHNVGLFYDNLEELIQKYQFTPDRIYNCDETGVTTVQKPTKMIAEKGVKRVGTAVSQEKGCLVTVCGTINAMGGFIPPFCMFPRVNTQPLWEEVLPIGSKAEGHAKASGWMTGDNFLNYLKHFHKYARPSQELPVLLLLDNHASHVPLAVINYCKENDIVLLSFPPHCSHELQPLDKTVYGPLKTFFNAAADKWMRNPSNAGKVMTIHNIPILIAEAFPKAFTPTNIIAGFESTGIQPLNRERIPEQRYLPSYVSDRPEPAESAMEPQQPEPSCSTHTPDESTAIISPHVIRPFAKAAPRSKTSKKKVTSQVLTLTPVKRFLEESAAAKSKNKAEKSQPRCKKSIFPVNTQHHESESDSETSDPNMELDDSDSDLLPSDLEPQEREDGEIENPTAQQLDERLRFGEI
ncbi:hypothetical protein RRG08_026448 [Elysia crispata]|uniref:DDE-1 domain-containing protein n=1 Tax=Elysia crispata TaxID=231223 RepID=A0AAE0Y3Q8_9GAST|nr:hypothetical protein RRG08_026448 [Elysia crispata]